MKKITMTGGRIVKVDDEDFELLNESRWSFNTAGTGYACRHMIVAGKHFGILMHRVIMNAPKGVEVDHIDGNSLNNQKKNLRLCSRSENMRNQSSKKNNATGIKGVGLVRGRFRARIKIYGKKIHLGYFLKLKDAAHAYNAASRKYHGTFGRAVRA